MQNQVPSIQSGRSPHRPNPGGAQRIALDENELAVRWGLSVKTLRRWRQEQLGPIFCKLGARVTYPDGLAGDTASLGKCRLDLSVREASRLQ